MNEDVILYDSVGIESSDSSIEVSHSDTSSEEVLIDDSNYSSLENSEDSSISNDLVESEEVSEEESEENSVDELKEEPTSTVIQVKENNESETGYDITELDVESLNNMSSAYLEAMQTVSPTTNDYYTWIDSDIIDYFSGIMANKPFNSYQACHLRHWVQNTQYYSYYDDYYYLWYDLDNNNNYVEVVRYNGQSNYVVNWGSGSVLNSSITYGSGDNQSDLRKGVSYVQEMAFLSVLAGVLVLYVVHAFFRHLKS